MRAFPEEKTKPSARLLWTQDTAGLHSLHTNKASPANRDPLDCIISLLRRIKTQVGTIEWCRMKMLRDLGVSGSSKQKPWHKRKVEWRGQEEVLGARMNCSMGMESDLRRKNGPLQMKGWPEVMAAISKMAANFCYQLEVQTYIHNEALFLISPLRSISITLSKQPNWLLQTRQN